MNSTVFRAFDPYLQREIAVKEIKKSNLGNDFDSYCNEARTMFASADPNIVGIEYVCETSDHIHLALPYFANGSLKARISLHPLGLGEFLKVSQGILSGLARIHNAGFLHLDLKPANIFFDDTFRPLIGDFGQCRRVSPSGAVTYPAMYKWTMPPEVLTSHVATLESDIYQLGVLLYRSINGDHLYTAQKSSIASDRELQHRIQRGRFPDHRVFLPHVPKRLRSIIRKAIRIAPAERYRSAIELAAALGRLPLPLDWETTSLGAGAFRWRAVRSGRTDLVVELNRDPTTGWQSAVWTVNGQDCRKRNLAGYWKRNLSYENACEHLTEVFAELSS
jgi:serine/threonine protein kinase